MSSKDRKEHQLSAPELNFSLDKALKQLKSEHQWQSENRNSITLVKNRNFCVMLMAFHKGARMPEHSTESPITFLVLSGAIRFTAAKLSQDLNPHDLITLEKSIPHEVEALEESSALLTLIYS
jgi:quercetin dioxygenase-like cupin family protein